MAFRLVERNRGNHPMTRSPWTPEQVAALRLAYPDNDADVVAKVLGHSKGSVYRKAAKLGLKKSDAFRARVDPRVQSTKFQPGNQPWNKGISYPSTGRAVETQFKPGHKPATTLPVGSYRINKDGHLQRKIGETPGCNSKRWRGVAELVWVEANGPLPPKHIVVFRPGQKTAVLEQITLDRVECISRAENARRNHPVNKSPELAKLVQLKGAITRQVNRINRASKDLQHDHHA